jgi:hypothetical protein
MRVTAFDFRVVLAAERLVALSACFGHAEGEQKHGFQQCRGSERSCVNPALLTSDIVSEEKEGSSASFWRLWRMLENVQRDRSQWIKLE